MDTPKLTKQKIRLEKKMVTYANCEETMNNNIQDFFDHAVSIVVIGLTPSETIRSKDGMVWLSKEPLTYSVEIDGKRKTIDKSLLSWLMKNHEDKVTTTLYNGSLSTTLDPVGFEVPVSSNCRVSRTLTKFKEM